MAEQYFATGRRKKSVARVELVPGSGVVTINGKSIEIAPRIKIKYPRNFFINL